MWQMAADGTLYTHSIISLWRAVAGLLLASIVAIPAAFLLEGWYPEKVKNYNTLFRLLSHINPFSLSPLFLVLFGIGEKAKLAIIVFVCFWPVFFHTLTAVRSVDPLLVKTARSLTVSGYTLAYQVLFPGALPTIITGIRVAAQMAVFMLIAAEMLGAQAGLGWLVHNSAMLFQIPRMYAGGLCIILIGILINKAILSIEKSSLFWKESVAMLDSQSSALHSYSMKRFTPVVAVSVAAILWLGVQEMQWLDLQRRQHEGNFMNHGSMNHGAMNHGNMNHDTPPAQQQNGQPSAGEGHGSHHQQVPGFIKVSDDKTGN